MSRSKAVPTVLAVLVAVVLAACGSDDSGGSSTADNAAATSSTQAAAPAATSSTPAAPAAPATKEEADAAVARCHNTYDPYMAKLIKIQDSLDGKPSYRTFAARVTSLSNDVSKFDPSSDSTSCAGTVARFASSSFLQFATATGTWAKCPVRKKCSAKDRLYLEARLAVGESTLAQARIGFSTMPKS